MLTLTDDLRQKIDDVHRSILNRFHYVSDQANYGVPEHWGLPKELNGQLFDDCDGFAIEAGKELAAIGIPHDAMMLAACATEQCATDQAFDHCILIIDADDGWYACDLRQPDFVSCAELVARGYRRRMIVQQAGKPINDLWDVIEI